MASKTLLLLASALLLLSCGGVDEASRKPEHQEPDPRPAPEEETPTEGKPVPQGAVDLGLSVFWATCNVGASSPESFGNHYAWGETEPKTDYSWNSYRWSSFNQLTRYNNAPAYGPIDNRVVLDSGPEGDDVASRERGSGWRMPTDREWAELRDQCFWAWVTQNGVRGRLVTSKLNRNSLFLPAAGCHMNTTLTDEGTGGFYWSSSLYVDHAYYTWFVQFDSDGIFRRFGDRCFGYSVRPVFEID